SLLAYFLLYKEQPTAPVRLELEQDQQPTQSQQSSHQQAEQREPVENQQEPTVVQPAYQQTQQPTQQPTQPAMPEPQPWSGPPPPVPNDAILLTLIRSALTALWQANLTGNYSVLRDLGAPSFKANSVEQFAQVFAPLRERNLDISGILLVQPKLYSKAAIGPKGNLQINGVFLTRPDLTNFNLLFQPTRDGRWQLLGISTSYVSWPQSPTTEASQGDKSTKPAVNQSMKPPGSKSGASVTGDGATATKPSLDVRDRIDTLTNAPTVP